MITAIPYRYSHAEPNSTLLFPLLVGSRTVRRSSLSDFYGNDGGRIAMKRGVVLSLSLEVHFSAPHANLQVPLPGGVMPFPST